MDKHISVKLLRLASEEMFVLYKPIDGIAMGSPLRLTLANFFLAHMKTKILDSFVC